MTRFYPWDIETFINCFLFTGKFEGDSRVFQFEISDRKNQRTELVAHLNWLALQDLIMVGYNSLGFDYPVTHELIVNPHTFTAQTAYLKAQEIFKRQVFGFTSIPYGDRMIRQLDLMKVNHFDNKNRTTSLKALEVAMRLTSVEDLPFNPHIPLTFPQMDELARYNIWDVHATEVFLAKNKAQIQMRQDIIDAGVLRGDVLNYSDTKIGREYMINKIGRNKCFIKGGQPRQSLRSEIIYKQIILPKIKFKTEQFQSVHEWFLNQRFWITKEKPSLEVKLANVDFVFGLGGLHASVENRVFESNDEFIIKDVDVSGMYVAVAIANGFYPEHLGQDFVLAYRQLQSDRAQYAKGTTMNALLKLAGNGVYGSSSDSYSCFYDPKYTYSVTLNGQLQLLQLVESLSLIPQLELIQANTDGITVRVPRKLEWLFNFWCRDWEKETGLKLEEVEYKKMWIRDVNNYLAQKTEGKVKRKGAYFYPEKETDYDGYWNKDYSNIAAQKGAEQVMVNGWDSQAVVKLMKDPFDFMLRYKTTGEARVFIGDKQMSKTCRYYVSKAGEKMKKVAPPKGEVGTFKKKNGITDEFYKKILSEIPKGSWDERIHTKNKSKYTTRVDSIEAGWLVKECNKSDNFNWNDVDYEYYTDSIKKLLIGETHVQHVRA